MKNPKIKFGPTGLGPTNQAEKTLEKYFQLGFKTCEILFTHGVYIKSKYQAETIAKKAKELGIELTIHAPYWINLNSAEQEKVKASKQRILKSLEIGTYLNASKVVFHPGFYGKTEKTKAYEKIKNEIKDILKTSKKRKLTPKLCPETTGKKNVFGSIDEISQLIKDTNCSFCIDFAHVLARYGSYNFKEIYEKIINLSKQDKLHIHFSGIVYGNKGEKHHKPTEDKEIKILLKELKKYCKNKEITIINESPQPIEDTLKEIKIWNKIK